MDKRYSGIQVMIDPPVIAQEELEQAKAADTAIYVICRNTGENYDRKAEKGDYYLSDAEVENLNRLTDPLLTGKTAAAFTRGLQENHPGYGVALKHFAANNQELDRFDMNSTVSERALREIYLRGFEICVKEAKPMTVMSSYNCINGLHTSSSYELLTDILRGEWGFDGFVMTDWDSHSEKPFDFHAGNDIIMGGYPTDVIAAAVSGKKPVFDKDGAVHQDKISMYGGVFHKTVEAWNSFSPEADGRDTLRVTVPADTAVSSRVEDAVKAGYAAIQDNSDGSRTAVYRGTDRGAYLPLGDIQRSAARVLTALMNGAPMRVSEINRNEAKK